MDMQNRCLLKLLQIPACGTFCTMVYITPNPTHPKKWIKSVVFDCSAKYWGESLNGHLLQGLDLINNLVDILCCFQKHPVAVLCDIQSMFHQFFMNSQIECRRSEITHVLNNGIMSWTNGFTCRYKQHRTVWHQQRWPWSQKGGASYQNKAGIFCSDTDSELFIMEKDERGCSSMPKCSSNEEASSSQTTFCEGPASCRNSHHQTDTRGNIPCWNRKTMKSNSNTAALDPFLDMEESPRAGGGLRNGPWVLTLALFISRRAGELKRWVVSSLF